jgi:hypothetical protein
MKEKSQSYGALCPTQSATKTRKTEKTGKPEKMLLGM